MHRLGRTVAAALLLLALAVPGVAAATEEGNPLSELPPEYEPVLDAAAEEFGVSADELRAASRDELETIACTELQGRSVDDIAQKAEAALAEAPAEAQDQLTPERRAELERRLPALLASVEAQVCASDDGTDGTGAQDAGGAGAGGGETDGAPAAGTVDFPIPTRVDTGAGGAATTSTLVGAGVLGLAFATMGGVAMAWRRRLGW